MVIHIDGSWHCMRTLHTCKGVTFFEDTLEVDTKRYKHALAINFSFLMKTIEHLLTDDTIIVFSVDNRSWRKKYFTKKGEKYKANRVKDEELMDWKVWGEINTWFGEQLRDKNNVIFTQVEGMEADDTAYIWSRYANKLGRDCLLIAGDGDWIQLINKNTHFLKKRGGQVRGFDFLRLESGLNYDIVETKNTIYQEQNEGLLNTLKNTFDTAYTNPYHFIFKKIVGGDLKDNVFPVFYTSTKNGLNKVRRRPSERIVEQVLNNCLGLEKITNFKQFYDEKFYTKFLKCLGNEMGVLALKEEDLFYEQLENNIKEAKGSDKYSWDFVIETSIRLMDVEDFLIEQVGIDTTHLHSHLLESEYEDLHYVITNYIETSCGGGYGEFKLNSIIEKFELNRKLLHLDKRNIPHEHIKEVLKGWKSEDVYKHKTKVNELLDPNNIIEGAKISTMTLISDNFRTVDATDLFDTPTAGELELGF